MKKVTVLAFILALVLGASASNVNFAALPAVSSPTLLPNGYGNLDWANFYYVDAIWNGAGAGFKQGPNSLDVAYMGGGICELQGVSCSASISSNAVSASAATQSFVARSAIVAAGYHNETIAVIAYNHGSFVGSQKYNLTTALQQIAFPTNWGSITQLVWDTNTGTVVLYSLNLQAANSVQPVAKQVSAEAADMTVPPSAPIHVVDPLASGAADSGSGSPIAIAPNAPRHVGPVTRAAAGGGGPIGPPVKIAPPVAPRPIARQLESATADASGSPIAIPPNAPRHVGPVTHVSATAEASASPIAIPPNAPKHVGPITRAASFGTTEPPIKYSGPTADKSKTATAGVKATSE
jgi:hypothetical protein